MKVNRLRVLIDNKEVYNSKKEKKSPEAFEFEDMAEFKDAVDSGEIDERGLVLCTGAKPYFFAVYAEGEVRGINVGTSTDTGIDIIELLELIFPEANIS